MNLYIYIWVNKKKMSTTFDHLYIYIPGTLWWPLFDWKLDLVLEGWFTTKIEDVHRFVLWHSTLQVTHPKELETAEAKGITSDPWDSENHKTLELCIWKKWRFECAPDLDMWWIKIGFMLVTFISSIICEFVHVFGSSRNGLPHVQSLLSTAM